jgi:chromate transporter
VKVAIYSFGGPAGQIAVMHRILVEEKRWVSENRFLHALNYCMLLPGPEAQQLATYIGWLLHKTVGGLTAGILFVLPGIASILLLSILYAGFQDTTFVQAFFFGLKPAVMAVVVEAVVRIGRRALKNEVMVTLAALAFIGIFFFDIPFPLIVFSAGVIGYVGGKFREDKFYVIKTHEPKAEGERTKGDFFITDAIGAHTHPSLGRSLRVLIVCLLLWVTPLILLALAFGVSSVYVAEGMFFSQTAVVSFGGAYAVLAYIAQQAVNTYGWLKPGEMLDGLGMAETTPGPLIMVVQFVGFMGAYRNPGTLDPMVSGVIGSLITTWVTFVPCFLWIFLGAPYIEYLRGNKSLSTALSAITAAVVGVIFNLAVWFSLHTLFGTVNEIHTFGMRLQVPVWQSLNIVSVLIAIGAFVALFRYRLNMITTLAGSAVVGLLYHLILR